MKLDLYVIPKRNGRAAIFSPTEALNTAESSDRLRQCIDWFGRRQNGWGAWMGRWHRLPFDYYRRLEDKIDPGERVLKAMAATNRFVVHTLVQEEFYRALRRQWWKHVLWFTIDLLIAAVAIVFTPFLAPIPGPNIFLYYPLLRALSHQRAIRGASSGLRSVDIEFRSDGR